MLLCAADTFRAAAADQLEIWAGRANVDIVRQHEGADPAAVVFDAISAAKARGSDVILCDTAGRLHNKANLMNELGKISRIIAVADALQIPVKLIGVGEQMDDLMPFEPRAFVDALI